MGPESIQEICAFCGISCDPKTPLKNKRDKKSAGILAGIAWNYKISLENEHLNHLESSYP